MAKFTDKAGQEWEVEITRGHLPAMRKDCGIDLRDALRPDNVKLAEAFGDDDIFGRLIWILCGPQAEKAGLTPETFAERFNGATCRAAVLAIWEALWDFSQGPEVATEATRTLRAGMEKAKGNVLGVMTQATSQILKSCATSSADSSASTPTPSP